MNNLTTLDPFAKENNSTENNRMTPEEVKAHADKIGLQVAEAVSKVVFANFMYGPTNESRAYTGAEILSMLSGDPRSAGSYRGMLQRLPESLKKNMNVYFGEVIPLHRRECGVIRHRLPEPVTTATRVRAQEPVGQSEPEPPIEAGPLNTDEPQHQEEEVLTEEAVS